MRKQSKRVAVTKSNIESAYLDVLAEKPDGKITVKEVCGRASVNRTTFYKYYEDADALGLIVRRDMLNFVEELMKETVPADAADTYEFTSQMIMTIYRDSRLRKMIILYKEPEFRRSVDEIVRKYYVGPKYGTRLTEDDWIRMTYINAAMTGLLEAWIADGMSISPEKISNSVIAFAKALQPRK